MTTADDVDFKFLSADSLSHLNYQQTIVYEDIWNDLIEFLLEKGKNPQRNIGYAESNIRPIVRRIHQVHQYCWEKGPTVIELTPDHADQFIEALNQDDVLNKCGEPYAEGSKRKFAQSLQAYFTYLDIEWEPKINFTDEEATLASDPFNLREREQLLNASLDYKSPPSYKNVSPEERDRWNAQIAQFLGKPKDEVGPKDWETVQRSWKVPSIISTALDCGWRAEMVGRLKIHFVNFDSGQIIIPPEVAVKNDRKWVCELSKRSAKILEKWREERANKPKYDDTGFIWLNRKRNPYNSATLNDLLNNLIGEAGIKPEGRKLTWHSIRHSTGMYVYNQEKDLELVAEVLRQASLEAARKYAHPTPETKQDIIESIQGGFSL
jgi:integrase